MIIQQLAVTGSRLERPFHTLFWERLLSAGVRVADGDEADWFFVPVQVRNPSESRLLLDVISYIKRTWPWWDKTGGSRHLIFQTGDYGSADMAASIADEANVLLANVTWLQHWGLHVMNEIAGWKPAHVIGKDIAIPYMIRPHQVKAFGLKVSPLHPLYVPEMKPRTDLLFFSGRICGDKADPNATNLNGVCSDVGVGYSGKVRQKFFISHHNRSGFHLSTKVDPYQHRSKSSKFCLAPPGSAFSHRQVMVSLLGCVPVILGDHIMQPFEPELSWSHFALHPSERQIPEIHTLLESIDDERLAGMQSNLKCAAEHMAYSSIVGTFMGESGRYDAFETIMEILRMKSLHPDASPWEYEELDPEYGLFMRCGQDVSNWGKKGIIASASQVEEQMPSISKDEENESTDLNSTAFICSHSSLDTPERSCKQCAMPSRLSGLSRSLIPLVGVPGGFICCGQENLAQCPRLWE